MRNIFFAYFAVIKSQSMRYPIIIKAAILAAAFTVLSSCNDKPDAEEASVTIDGSSEMRIPAAGADTVFSITASSSWNISTEGCQWLTVNPESGNAGNAAVSLSVQANADENPRSASVKIVSGTAEAVLDIVQEGSGTGNTENPGKTGKKPSSVSFNIKEEDSSMDYIWYFGYDDRGRMISYRFTTEDEAYYPEVNSTFEYFDGYILNTAENLDYYTETNITLDEYGRAVKTVETSKDKSSGEVFPASSREMAYNEDGYIDSYDGYIKYIWENGDIDSVSAPYDTFIALSDKENSGYLDLNWLWCDMAASEASLIGLNDMLGNRSAHIAYPTAYMWDGISAFDIHTKRSFTEQELGEGTFTYQQKTSSFSDLTCNIETDGDGDVVKVVSEMPVYWTEYVQTVVVTVLNPDDYTLDSDGNKVYSWENVSIEILDTAPTGNTGQTSQVLTVSIAY